MYWCLLSITGVAIIGLAIQRATRKVIANENIIAHVDEFIGNLASSVFIMELGVITQQHGRYSALLLVTGYLHSFLKLFYFNKTGGFITPLSFIASYYKDRRQVQFSLFFAASIIATQFAGIYAGQQFARLIWTLEDDMHVQALKVACTTSISSNYPWYLVAMCEAIGVMILVCSDAITPSSLKLACGAFVYMNLYFFLSHISGSYFSPVFATIYSFRCAGHTSDWEHLAVYWIAPAVGMVISYEILEGIKKLVARKDAKKME